MFHVSQLRRCFKDPIRGVDREVFDIQEDLTYREHPVRILDEAERKTHNQTIKFLKIQWSNHSEEEATWERQTSLRQEYPAKPRILGRDSCKGGRFVTAPVW